MKDQFVTTDNVRRLGDVVDALLGSKRGMPRLGLLTGDVGLGKSWAVDELVVNHAAVYVRAARGMTASALLRTIVRRLGERPPWGRHDSLLRAVDLLSLRASHNLASGLLVVDEVGYLVEGARHDRFPECLDTLRDLSDESQTPLLLVGEPEVAETLARYAATNRHYRRFWERILIQEEFKPLCRGEVIRIGQLLAGLEIAAEAAEMIMASTEGNLRRLVVLLDKLKKVCRASQKSQVTPELLNTLGPKVMRPAPARLDNVGRPRKVA